MSIFDSALPEGWVWEALDQRYRITKKPRDLDLAQYHTVPFVPMEGVPANGSTQLRYETRGVKELSSGTYFERGDVLLSKITPSFENGKQGKADDLPSDFGFASTELIPISPARDANGLYLFYYLLHPEVRSYLAGKMEGSTGRQRVPERAVRALLVPLPPLAEQEVIAAVLAAIQSHLALEGRAAANARELKLGAMQQLFTRGLRGEPLKETELGPLPETWDVVTLGTLGRIGNGSTPRRTEPRYWTNGTLPWLTSAKIHEGVISAADEFVTPLASEECHLPKVPAGSVLVAITGQGKTLGNVAIITLDTFVSQHLAYVAIHRSDVDANFIRHYLSSRYEYLRGLGQAGGSTKGALTCAGLKMLSVPLPPVEEQREIAHLLDAIDQNADVHDRKRLLISELFDTLLHDLTTGRRRVGRPDRRGLNMRNAVVPHRARTRAKLTDLRGDGDGADRAKRTPDERLGMMWQLARDAWTFTDHPERAESRLQRHVVRTLRRER